MAAHEIAGLFFIANIKSNHIKSVTRKRVIEKENFYDLYPFCSNILY